MRSRFVGVGLALAILGFAAHASAAPITYEISGTGSGMIGGTSFSSAHVVFTATADTNNVVSLYGGVAYGNAFDTLTVSIAGVGTATITDASEIFGIPSPIVDPEIPPVPIVIFGRTDFPPDLSSFTGMGAVGSFSLAGYDLTTAIGPIAGLGGVGFIDSCGTLGHDPCLQTSMGPLSFTSNISPTGEGTFTATLRGVPEPATVLLMGGGLAALVRRSRSRSRS